MRHLTRIIIVLVVLSSATASPAMLQSNPEGKVQTFTISGNTGLPGVIMKGIPGDPVTDQNGNYSVAFRYGWSGTLTPVRKGYSFSPPSKIYQNVSSDLANQDYKAEIITYTISGQVGMPGVMMQGLPGNPVTDNRGYYTSTVEYGWAGTVKPVKEGYTFNPPRQSYTIVTANQQNRNYAVEQQQQKVWQFQSGQWEPMMAGGDGRSSRQAGSSAGYRSTITPTADRKVLVVPAAEVKAEDLAEIMEDMQVMSHILDERFKETRRVQGAFTDFGDFFGRDNRKTEAVYLQGYGVLFSMEVNFAFSPPPKPQEQGTEQTAENVDSTWQQAKQQMLPRILLKH